jgi:hypothetical protein
VVHLLWESDVQHAGQEDITTMKRHRHTPEQIVRKLREGDRMLNEGIDLAEVLRQLEVSDSTWNRWRAQYGGMKANDAKRLRELESDNARLKKLLAEAELDKAMLRELAEGTSDPGASPASSGRARRSLRVSERRACRVVGQHRSTQRLAPRPRPAEEEKVRRRLRELAREHPRWG